MNYSILFVCYGNICRSPMAEMIFKNIVYQNHRHFMFHCESRATSMEEYGNGMYPKAIEILKKNHIPVEKHVVSIIKKDDYLKYDFIICMDYQNYDDLLEFFQDDEEKKIRLLLSFAGRDEEIEDPWYTNQFEKVYSLIDEGCRGLFQYLTDLSSNDTEA